VATTTATPLASAARGAQYAWHSTLHASSDTDGWAAGYGGEGQSSYAYGFGGLQYGRGGECVDTSEPFAVEASFPVDGNGELRAVQVSLSQDGHPCNLSLTLEGYQGLPAISKALADGVTPVVTYWASKDMLWLDGEGPDGKGPCKSDKAVACAPSVAFGEFSVSPIGKPAASDEPAGALETQAPTADLQHSAGGEAISAQPGDAAGMGDCLTAAAANQRLPDDSPVGRHGRSASAACRWTSRSGAGRPAGARTPCTGW